MKVSVVIPALNEAGNIGRLVSETYSAVPATMLGEVIVVDDGSTDGSVAEVQALIDDGAHPELRCLRHDARSGQSTALRTGITAARHPIIATMDGDGQNDPHDIPKLAAKIAMPGEAGPALVGGVRTNRQAEGSKRFASTAANKIRDFVLRDDCPDTGCGIKVYQRDAFLRLPFFTSIHRYLPAFFKTYGHEVAFVPVNDRARVAGRSKYTNVGRAFVGLYDLIGVSWLRARTKAPGVSEIAAAQPVRARAAEESEADRAAPKHEGAQ
ncbi:MAG: glycosyltransferase family 2 protein [Pseudomonadota bacterium]